MDGKYLFVLAVLAITLPIAFVMDRNSWRKKSREELDRMLSKPDWRENSPALKELQRRGEDLSPYIPIVLGLMTSESSLARSAGKLALQQRFPELASAVHKFSPTGPLEGRTAVLAPLIAKYGVAKPKV